jgi:hypothetical protein
MAPSSADNKYFDNRYFFRDDRTQTCHCTCGLARNAGAILLRKQRPDPFLEDGWLRSLHSHASNPSVVGSIVEQTCLSAISSRGFHHDLVHFPSVDITIFEGDLLSLLPTKTSKSLFVPADFNFKNIDALYLDVNSAAKSVLVVPFQITINKKRRPSGLFYANWSRWKSHFQGYKLSTTFVWVVENRRSSNLMEEKVRSSRRGPRVVNPKYPECFVTVGDIYPPLGERLASLRRTVGGLKRKHVQLPVVPDHDNRGTVRPLSSDSEDDIETADASDASMSRRLRSTQKRIKHAIPLPSDRPSRIVGAAGDATKSRR